MIGIAGLLVSIATSSACSIAIPSLGSDPVESTGSINPVRAPLSPELGTEDWRRARAALAVALDPQGNGASVTWDNPESHIKGAFVPVGGPYVQADTVCRNFVATLTIGEDRSSYLQGMACRLSPDEWELSGVKPWKKPS